MTTRMWLSLAGLAVVTGLLAAAGPAEPARKGGTLRISMARDVDSVDPGVLYSVDGWQLEFATCANLYNYPDAPAPKGAVVIPEVATGFPKVSPDGKTQTIELKRTYRFHTGARVTAANYVAAFNRDANPKLESSATYYLHEIVGADAVIDGKAQTIAGVSAPGPYTLRIRTTQPVPDLVARLTMPFFCPVATNTPPKEIDRPLGSGPYFISSYVPNRALVLSRNRYYRGPRPANVDRVVRTIASPEACRVAVERNELDYCIGGVPGAEVPGIVAEYGINRKGGQFFFNSVLSTSYFAFNHDRPAFKGVGQIPLKQAINWALDRHALVAAAGYLGGKRTDQILPPAMGRNASIYPLSGVSEGSLAKARALLAKAKLKPPRLVLYAPSFGGPGAQAQIFRFNLLRLGIDVDIKYLPNFGALTAKTGVRGEPYDVALIGWQVDYADPYSFFSTLNGNLIQLSGNTNAAYFDRPKYNREIERISRLSGKARNDAWADLDVEMMRDDPPWAPYMTGAVRDFVSKSLGCYVADHVYGQTIRVEQGTNVLADIQHDFVDVAGGVNLVGDLIQVLGELQPQPHFIRIAHFLPFILSAVIAAAPWAQTTGRFPTHTRRIPPAPG